MRKLTLASLLLTTILLTNFSFAQTDSVCTKDQIQFHLVNDYSVSYLKMLTPTSGLRFKIDLGLSGNGGDKDITDKHFFTSSQPEQIFTQNRAEEASSNYQYINLVMNYIMVNKLAKEVAFYFGAGPLVSFSRTSSESNSNTTNVNQNMTTFYISKSEYLDRSFGLGVQVGLGIEVMFTQKFSFLAEFNLNGTYSWNKYWNHYEYQSSTVNKEESTSDGTSWNYGLNQLKLGIAYRF